MYSSWTYKLWKTKRRKRSVRLYALTLDSVQSSGATVLSSSASKYWSNTFSVQPEMINVPA